MHVELPPVAMKVGRSHWIADAARSCLRSCDSYGNRDQSVGMRIIGPGRRLLGLQQRSAGKVSCSEEKCL